MRFIAAVFSIFLLSSALQAESIRRLSSDQPGIAAAVIIPEGTALFHTAQIFPSVKNESGTPTASRAEQVRSVFANLSKALGGAGNSWAGLVKVNVYCSDIESVSSVQQFLKDRFSSAPIAVSFVVTRLPENAAIGIDAVAVSTRTTREVKVSHEGAILPAGRVAYISGQGVVGDVESATKETLEQLRATLEFLGLSTRDVVQSKAFLKKIEDVPNVRAEYARFFGSNSAPPLVFVEGENGDFPVVIEMVVAGGEPNKSTEAIEYITPSGMTKSPVYSKVVRVNHGAFVYTSGLYAGSGGDTHAETIELFQKLQTLVQTACSDIRHIVKATYYVSDAEHLRELNSYRSQVFNPNRPPATTKALVRDVGMAKRGITADCIAVIEPTAKSSSDK